MIYTVIIIILTLMYFILLPIGTIWSLNTLFQVGIEYNFYNWLAALWITFLIGGGISNDDD